MGDENPTSPRREQEPPPRCHEEILSHFLRGVGHWATAAGLFSPGELGARSTPREEAKPPQGTRRRPGGLCWVQLIKRGGQSPACPRGREAEPGRVRGSRGCTRQPCAGLHRGPGLSGGDAAGICTKREGFTRGTWQQIGTKTCRGFPTARFPPSLIFMNAITPPFPAERVPAPKGFPTCWGG